MRDDFDDAVADRFKLLDQVSVPDTWSQIQVKLLDERPGELIDRIGRDMTVADLDAPTRTGEGGPRRGWMIAAAVLLVVVAAVVFVERGSRRSAVVMTATPASTTAPVDSPFATAIESAGVLITPSAEEVALARDTSLYQPVEASTQVSSAANFVSMRECRSRAACGTGWAYVTGAADGSEVHRGVLGEADALELFVLDDRFFVAMESSPSSRPAPTAWLIDSVSGGRTALTWRDEPTTLNSPEQAVVVSEGLQTVAQNARRSALDDEELAEFISEGSIRSGMFLPRVVDARDGTIRPLAIPDNASAGVPVIQTGTGRIWIGTTPDVDVLGLAYSDDGGGTWTAVALPAQLPATSDELEQTDSVGDVLLSIAADGDRVAVTDAWSSDERDVYVSSDAGLTWSTANVAVTNRSENGAHLYVLADGRLLLVRSFDPYVNELLVSTGPDWTELERETRATRAVAEKTSQYVAAWNEGRYVSVNRQGIASMFYPVEMFDDGTVGGMPDAPPSRYRFSTDLRNWQTIAVLDD